MYLKNWLKKYIALPAQRSIAFHDELCMKLDELSRKIDSLTLSLDKNIVTTKMFCVACGKESAKFLPSGVDRRPNVKCPSCHSLERHRALWFYFENSTDIFKHNIGIDRQIIKLLHFGPEKAFYDKFSNISYIDYYPVDLKPKRYANIHLRDVVDIQNIPYPDNHFDLIINIHVLEHIPDDKKAMKELQRVIKPGGSAFISVPMSDIEDTLENPAYDTDELRLKHYGQRDHLRRYSQRTFPNLLKKAGFDVSEINLTQGISEDELKRLGLARNEKMFLCSKNIALQSKVEAS